MVDFAQLFAYFAQGSFKIMRRSQLFEKSGVGRFLGAEEVNPHFAGIVIFSAD